MRLIFIFLISAITVFAQTPEWSRKYHKGYINCMELSKDGKKMLTGSSVGEIMLWDIAKADTVKTFKILDTTIVNPSISNISYNSSDSYFTVSTGGFSTLLFDEKVDTAVKKIQMPREIMRGNVFISFYSSNEMNMAYFSDQDKNIHVIAGAPLSQSNEGSVGEGTAGIHGIYNLESEKLTIVQENTDYYKKFKISPDRKYIASLRESRYSYSPDVYNDSLLYYYSFTGAIDRLDTAGGYIFQSLYGPTLGEAVKNTSYRASNIGFTGDSKYLLSSDFSGKVYIQKVNDKDFIDSLGSRMRNQIQIASGDVRGKYYITTHTNGTVYDGTIMRFWERGSHNIYKEAKLPGSMIELLAFLPDSVNFIAAHYDGSIALWNIDSLVNSAVPDTVFMPTLISVSPVIYLCAGDEETSIELHVAAQPNFGEKLTYQWKLNNIDLVESDSTTGVNTPDLTIKKLASVKRDSRYYSVSIAPESKPDHSITANIPVIFQEEPHLIKPILPEISKTNPSYFIARAELFDPVNATYQWFKDDVEIPGATKSYYSFSVTDPKGQYTLLVTNPCGSTLMTAVIMGIAEENPFKNIQFSAEPNPFKNSTTIHFSLPKSLKIKLAVTDILGKEIAVLKDELTESGEQSIVFKNENLPDGMYYITLSGEGLLQTIPVQIIR